MALTNNDKSTIELFLYNPNHRYEYSFKIREDRDGMAIIRKFTALRVKKINLKAFLLDDQEG